VDCLISNCVINLAPDKRAVFGEMFRVLKPGGRVAISDIALKRPLPEEVSRDIQAYVGCLAGAALIADYRRMLLEAGFSQVEVIDARKDLGAYRQAGEGCCSGDSCCGAPDAPRSGGEVASPASGYDINDFAASVQVFAIKNRTERSAPDDGKESQ
jgi:SAM-dependent methyltransferase